MEKGEFRGRRAAVGGGARSGAKASVGEANDMTDGGVWTSLV